MCICDNCARVTEDCPYVPEMDNTCWEFVKEDDCDEPMQSYDELAWEERSNWAGMER